MECLRWIREGDRAACDGMVIEGDPSSAIHGRPYAFEGARLICRKKCVIAEGVAHRTLTHGRKAVLHGMKTSGGCPLLSSLDNHEEASDQSTTSHPHGYPAQETSRARTVAWLLPRVDYGDAATTLSNAAGALARGHSAPGRRIRRKTRWSSVLLLAIGAICVMALYRYFVV